MKAPFFNGAWHEAWDIANWTTDLGTTSHAWCSGPTALLPQKVLGLEPISAGWKLFSVRPEWCGLSWAKGDVNTPYGKIAVAWNRDSQGKLQLSFNVPVGCKALVEMQVSSSKDYTINGVPAQTCPGIGSFKAEKGKLLFDASPGKYRFQTVD